MPAFLGDRILANLPTAGWLGFEFRLLLSAKRRRREWDYLRFFELGFARLGALSWLTAFAGGEGGIDFALLSPAALASLVWLEPFGGPWVQIPPFTCREAAPERVGFEPTDGFPSSVFKTDAIDHSATSPGCCGRGVIYGGDVGLPSGSLIGVGA